MADATSHDEKGMRADVKPGKAAMKEAAKEADSSEGDVILQTVDNKRICVPKSLIVNSSGLVKRMMEGAHRRNSLLSPYACPATNP